MKKIINVFVVLMLFGTISTAQNISAIGGIGLSSINGSESWKGKVGGIIGVEAGLFELSNNASLGAGLVFSFQGSGWEESMYDLSGSVNTSYLNVPILLNYTADGGFYVELGVQPAFLLSAKDKYDGKSEDFKESLQSFDVGIPIGAGLSINEAIAVGARAVIGMNNIDNTGSSEADRNFMVLATVKYKLKSKN